MAMSADEAAGVPVLIIGAALDAHLSSYLVAA